MSNPRACSSVTRLVYRGGTLLDAGVNSSDSMGHVRTVLLMYPSCRSFSLPRSFSVFLGSHSPRFFLPRRPRKRSAAAYLNFRSKGNARRTPPLRWSRFHFDEGDTRHPVNGSARDIREHPGNRPTIGMYGLVTVKRHQHRMISYRAIGPGREMALLSLLVNRRAVLLTNRPGFSRRVFLGKRERQDGSPVSVSNVLYEIRRRYRSPWKPAKERCNRDEFLPLSHEQARGSRTHGSTRDRLLDISITARYMVLLCFVQ